MEVFLTEKNQDDKPLRTYSELIPHGRLTVNYDKLSVL